MSICVQFLCAQCFMYTYNLVLHISYSYQKVRGGAQTGEVPSNYRCYKCQKMGHWIKNCPLNVHHEHVEVKRNTGIPRSFIDAAAAGNSLATESAVLPPIEAKQEIPDDLICSICKDLLNDAVMISCCGSSFCDECKLVL